jgi:hypothetical protein
VSHFKVIASGSDQDHFMSAGTLWLDAILCGYHTVLITVLITVFITSYRTCRIVMALQIVLPVGGVVHHKVATSEWHLEWFS